jgi:hypothetical protein
VAEKERPSLLSQNRIEEARARRRIERLKVETFVHKPRETRASVDSEVASATARGAGLIAQHAKCRVVHDVRIACTVSRLPAKWPQACAVFSLVANSVTAKY